MRALLPAILLLGAAQDPAAAEAGELKTAWTRVLELAKERNTREMSGYFAGLRFSKEEFIRFFGKERAGRHFSMYEDWTLEVDKDLARIMADHVRDKGYDSVSVALLNTLDEKEMIGGDKASLGALADRNVRMYRVLLEAPGDVRPYSVTCLLKSGTEWRSPIKVGWFFRERE